MLDMNVFSNKLIASIIFLLLAILTPLIINNLMQMNINKVETKFREYQEGLSNNEITKMKQHMKDMTKNMRTSPKNIK